jgi:hypothetical protein
MNRVEPDADPKLCNRSQTSRGNRSRRVPPWKLGTGGRGRSAGNDNTGNAPPLPSGLPRLRCQYERSRSPSGPASAASCARTYAPYDPAAGAGPGHFAASRRRL